MEETKLGSWISLITIEACIFQSLLLSSIQNETPKDKTADLNTYLCQFVKDLKDFNKSDNETIIRSSRGSIFLNNQVNPMRLNQICKCSQIVE